jgi:hypothetical protein
LRSAVAERGQQHDDDANRYNNSANVLLQPPRSHTIQRPHAYITTHEINVHGRTHYSPRPQRIRSYTSKQTCVLTHAHARSHTGNNTPLRLHSRRLLSYAQAPQDGTGPHNGSPA